MWLPTPSFLISSYSIILSASSSQSHYRFHIILFSSAYQSFSDPSCSDANLNGLISLQSWYNADLGSSLVLIVLVICHIGWSLCQRTSLLLSRGRSIDSVYSAVDQTVLPWGLLPVCLLLLYLACLLCCSIAIAYSCSLSRDRLYRWRLSLEFVSIRLHIALLF